MKKHKGMRPQDIVILLKIAVKAEKEWYMKDLSYELGISASEVSESLHRSALARLVTEDKKQLMKQSLLEFLEFGLKYVYPVQPSGIVRGLSTAHSAQPLVKEITGKDKFVWPWAKGTDRGQAIEPLHTSVPQACIQDQKLYEMLALTDAIRVGRKREQQIAIQILKERIF